MSPITLALSILIGAICYSGLIWFVCRLISTNHLDEDEQ